MGNVTPEHDRAYLGMALIVGAVLLLSRADAAVKYFSHRRALWQLFLLVSCLTLPFT